MASLNDPVEMDVVVAFGRCLLMMDCEGKVVLSEVRLA